MEEKNKNKYSIIVPTYNERLNTAFLVYLILKHLRDFDFEIIVVDDASPDGTQEVVKKLQQSYGEDRILLRPRPRKPGLGAQSQVFAKLCQTGVDTVTGTPYVKGGGVHGWNLMRKLTSRGANILAHMLLWPGVSDLDHSAKLVLEDVIISCVPITFVDRVFESSKLGGSEIVD